MNNIRYPIKAFGATHTAALKGQIACPGNSKGNYCDTSFFLFLIFDESNRPKSGVDISQKKSNYALSHRNSAQAKSYES